jgi:hypothetical protein
VLEGSTDQTIQKFKDFVDGYYRTLATKATAQPDDGAPEKKLRGASNWR